MTELTLRICNICFTESIPLSKVVFYQCGHKACQQCAEGTYSQSYRCAECRRQKGIPHRIYLNSDDLTIGPTATQVIEHAKEADKQSAENGPNETTKNLEGSSDSGSTHETAEIRRAKKQIEDMSFQVREMQATLSSLQNTVRAADGAVQEHKGEADRLRRRAQEYLALIKHKDTEVLKLQEQLKERDTKEILMKTKLKALAKQHKKASTMRSQDGDASLQIEGREVKDVCTPAVKWA